MRILGLTGSIGMGKTTTAAMFRARGVPIHDADGVVHDLYAGPRAALVEAAFPGVTRDGAVDRRRLAERVTGRPAELRRLEAIVHPLVREAEEEFLRAARSRGERIVLLDIPLLLETGGAGRVDAVLVVTAPAGVQRARVLSRPGMSEETFEALMARQMPDAEKRARAHFIVDTGQGIAAAEDRVAAILRALSFAI